MRHQTDDVARFVAQAGDIVRRPVWIGVVGDEALTIRVTKNDLTIALEPCDYVGLRIVVALAMGNWNAQNLARAACHGERRVNLLHFDQHMFALELDAAIAEHRARKQSRLEKHLKTVADAEHGAAGFGELPDRRHDRGKARDGAGPEVVAVREASRQDHGISLTKAALLVPHVLRLVAEHMFDGVLGIVIAVGSRKHDNGKLHADTSSTISIR